MSTEANTKTSRCACDRPVFQNHDEKESHASCFECNQRKGTTAANNRTMDDGSRSEPSPRKVGE